MRVFITVEAIFVVVGWAALPWGFWGYEHLRGAAVRREALARGCLWGGLLAWAALAGPQLFLLEVVLLGAYIAAREAVAWARGRGVGRPSLHLALGTVVAMVVLGGLACFFYVPTWLEGNLLGLRPYLEAVPREAVLPAPVSLLGELLVARFGPNFSPLSHARYVHYPDFAFYLGWSVLALAGVGLLARRRGPTAWGLAAVVAFALLLAVGPTVPYNPVYWLVRRLPVLADLVRYSLRGLVGLSVGLAALAGMGADWLAARLRRPPLRWGMGGALALLVAQDFWPGSQAYFPVDEYLRPDEVEVHRWLDAQTGPDRYWVPVQVEPYGWHYARSSVGAEVNRHPVITEEAFLWVSTPCPAVQVLAPATRQEVEGLGEGMTLLGQAALSLAAARYGLVHRGGPVYEEVVGRLVAHRGWQVLRKTEHVYLLENPEARPYLQAYRKGALVADEAFPLEWLPGCLERGYALVEEAPGEGPWTAAGGDGCASLPPVEAANARLEGGPPVRDEIRVRAQSREDFVLMVAESWYPHWRVEVDGEDVPLLRVNGGFLGAAVPAGWHEVRFTYRVPAYQWACLAASGLTLLGVVALLLVSVGKGWGHEGHEGHRG
ncbi:MAG: YfhO family protein [Anaerolineae bacterium]|nr:YfhO family protein [Anaerolineae bacterium]